MSANRPMKNLNRCLAKAGSRIFAARLLLGVLFLLPVAILAGALFAVAGQFTLQTQVQNVFTLLFFSCALCFLAYFTTKGLSKKAVSLAIDRRAALSDRFTSALEFCNCRQPTLFMAAQIADAENCAGKVDIKKAFPIWPAKGAKLLLIAVLVTPLLALGLGVDFTRYFQSENLELSRNLPVEPLPMDIPDANDLARLEVPKRLNPFIEPIKNYIANWKKHVAAVKKELAQTEKQREQMITKAIHKGSGNGLAKEIASLPWAVTDDNIHISDMASMGVHAPEEYRNAFEQLDDIAFENEPTMEDVEALETQMKDAAIRKSTSSTFITMGAAMAAQMSTDADEVGAFKNAVQGAMQQSFNEFLMSYSAHLGELVDTKKALNEKAKADGVTRRQVMSSAPPPPDAKLKMMKLDPKATSSLQLSPGSFKEMKGAKAVKTSQTPSDSRAGQGSGTAEGAIKMAQIEAQTQMSQISGQMGEGKSPIQIIEDVDSFTKEDYSSEDYRFIYAKYTDGASQVLETEQIPIVIKSFVRDYFMSINPDRLEKDIK